MTSLSYPLALWWEPAGPHTCQSGPFLGWSLHGSVLPASASASQVPSPGPFSSRIRLPFRTSDREGVGLCSGHHCPTLHLTVKIGVAMTSWPFSPPSGRLFGSGNHERRPSVPNQEVLLASPIRSHDSRKVKPETSQLS